MTQVTLIMAKKTWVNALPIDRQTDRQRDLKSRGTRLKTVILKSNNAENLLSDWHFAEPVLKPRFPHGMALFSAFFRGALNLVAALVVNVIAGVMSFTNLSAIFLEGRGWTTFGQEFLKNWLIVGLTFFRKCWNGRGKESLVSHMHRNQIRHVASHNHWLS